MRKTFTLFIALMALTVSSWAQTPTVITWDASDLATVHVEMGYDSPGQSQTIKDITVTNNAVYTAGQNCDFLYQSAYNYCGFSMRNGGSLTFATESGKLKSIVITMSNDYVGTLPLVEGSGWELDGENAKLLKWTGNAASVILQADGSSNSLASGPISSIAFTIEGFLPAVKWIGNDLTSVNIEMENGVVAQGKNQSQTVNDITITANAPAKVTEDDYNFSAFSTWVDEYDISNKSTSLSVSGEGSLTFAPASGKLKKIVITCETATDAGNINDENDEWSWDANTSKLTWTGEATSVVMTPADPSYGFGFMNISSVVFTVTSEEPPVGPTPSGASIIWEQRQVSHVDFTYNATSPVIKNIILSLTETSNSGYYSFSGSQLLIQNNADLKFKSIVGNLTGIVITCSSADHHADLPTDWEYDAVAQTFTWAGDAEEVTLTGDIYATITSIEFAYTPAEAPRLGQAFWDGLGQKYVITGLHTAKMPQQTIYGTLDIPASVIDQGVIYYITEIADNAFKDNDRLSNAYIGENIARIGAHACEGCTHMRSFSLDGGVLDEIGVDAFKNCKLLAYYESNTTTPPVLGNNVFAGDELLNHILIDYNGVDAYKEADGWSAYESIIDYRGIDASVGEKFFDLVQMYTGLYEVTTPATYGTPGEAKVIPYTSYINDIYPITRTGTLVIPEDANYMGSEYAITGIGENAYKDSTRFNAVMIPQQVTSIEAGAFLNCTGVENVYFLWENPNTITWYDRDKGLEFATATSGKTKIYVPKGKLAAYQSWAPAWASRMFDVELFDVDVTQAEDPDHSGRFYRTFFDSENDYLLPPSVWAHVGYVQDNEFILRSIAYDGQILPKNTAVVLESETPIYHLIKSEGSAPAYTGKNDLRGTDVNLAVSSLPAAQQDKVYVLGKEAWINSVRQVGMGLYRYTGTTLGAHKAYMIVGGTSGAPTRARFLFRHEDETTGVENVQSDKVQCTKILRDGQLIIIKDGKEYNAQGQIVK